MTLKINQRPGGANVPPFDEVQDTRKFTVIRDEFAGGLLTTGNVGDLGWSITQITGDSGGAAAIVAGVAGKVGVVSLSTGSTTPAANDEAAFTLASGQLILPTAASGNMAYAHARISLPSIAGVEFRFGFADATPAASRDTDGVFIEFDASASADWVGVSSAASSASTVTNADIADVAAATWYDVEVAANQGSAYFWVNQEFVGQVSTNLPTVALVPAIKVEAEGAAEKFVQVDAAMIRVPVV